MKDLDFTEVELRQREGQVSPAAMAAYGRGEVDNFLTAITPGGIEAQEAEGQIKFLESESLPVDGLKLHLYGDQLKALGFVFGKPFDNGMFIETRLPPGWSKRATSSSYWTDLLDQHGRVRAGIFYKAAFYDRSSHIDLRPAVISEMKLVEVSLKGRELKETYQYERGEAYLYSVAMLADKEVFRTEERLITNKRECWEMQDVLRGEIRKFISENYPNWEDPFAYWPE